MTILITTPNGKVGSEVVKALTAQGATVRVGAHSVEKAQQDFPGTQVVPFDFENTESIKAALDGVSALYLAAPGDFGAAPQIAVVDLAKAAGVKRIVRLSAIGVENGEGVLRDVERAVEASGLEWTILRPNWFFQNYATMYAAGVRDGVIAEPAEEGATSFIDARDIAAVAVKALTEDGHNGQGYTLTGSQALTRYQLADIITKVTDKPVKYLPLTDEQFRANVAGVLPAHYVETMSYLFGIVRAGWTAATTDTVKQVLGRDPISFAQFAQDYRQVWL